MQNLRDILRSCDVIFQETIVKCSRKYCLRCTTLCEVETHWKWRPTGDPLEVETHWRPTGSGDPLETHWKWANGIKASYLMDGYKSLVHGSILCCTVILGTIFLFYGAVIKINTHKQ